MRFTLFATWVGVIAAKTITQDTDCKYSLEILQVQDGSTSFAGEIKNMANFMADLTEELRNLYGEFKFGVSSFVDKPIPLRGYGNYGNWDYAADYCYREHSALTEDNAEIISGLRELASNLGSGNDFPENPMEALIFAAGDEAVGWSPQEVTHSPSGRPIVRMIMLVTDDIPHFPTDAEDAVARFWNWPRTYPDPSNPMISTGGFGSHGFHALPNLVTVNTESEVDLHEYLEMADLFAIFDHEGDLSPTQATRLDKLIDKFGPYPFPDVVTHPGDDSIRDCTKTEYPTLENVSEYLKARNTNIIFLVTEPPSYANEITRACRAIGMSAGVDCLVQLYKGYAETMGIAAVVASIDGENTKDRILESIVAMTDMMCLATTTAAPTTSTSEESISTEDQPGTDAPATTSSATLSDTITDKELPPPGLTSEGAVSTTGVPGHETHSSVSTEEGRSEASVTTTDSAVVPPPIKPPGGGGGSEGPNVGVITGSAIGGAAAVIVGGILYAKFGGGLFGGSAPAGGAAVTQVDTPESAVEREIVEEVTMDMFQ